uniref:ZU5 domain-containing protein n=1 Tax=Eptatretus burgeri TaxID=7764 RepID=A0A8C4WUD6_EPTBU
MKLSLVVFVFFRLLSILAPLCPPRSVCDVLTLYFPYVCDVLLLYFQKKPSGETAKIKNHASASFLRAARNGNLERIQEHLKSGMEINTCNQNGLNALHLASKEGHVDVVKELLNQEASIDAATKKGNTALHIAALAGQTEIVKVLVQYEGNMNAQSQVSTHLLARHDGFTPLAVALQQGHQEVVSLLLESDTKGKVRLPALHIAARKDDTNAVALLLQHEHKTDVTSKSGFTPLHITAHYGNINVATLLLNLGAAVDFKARNGITPLHVAAKRGNTNMVKLLLDRGATIDAKTRDGLTPLHCAARSGHDKVIEMLLDRDAPILAKTKNGLSPLHMATQGEHLACVQHLLSREAPVDDVTLDFLTPLHVAAHCGHYRVAKLLLERGAEANTRALNGFTPLHIACKKNRVKVIELLLKHLASIHTTTESGLTPIHVAAFMGHLNVVQLLLQNGASCNVTNVRGETPLHMASRAGQLEVVKTLLQNGARVDVKAREDQMPLHIASRLGKPEIVQLLLQSGSDPNASTASGATPLYFAAREGHVDVANLLLSSKATVTPTTKKGFTPLHIASKYGRIEVAKLLLQNYANPDPVGKNNLTPMHIATHYDHEDLALLLLEKRASPHSMAKNGYTPLHIASKKNQVEAVQAMLAAGADSSMLTQQGVAPIHLASLEGHAEVVALLLARRSNPGLTTKGGLTPLHLAAQEDCVGVAEVLFKYKVDGNAVTKMGYTPLHVACHYGNIKMVNFLLRNAARINSRTKQGHMVICLHVLESFGTNTVSLWEMAVTVHKRGSMSAWRRGLWLTNFSLFAQTTMEKHKLNVPETMNEPLDLSDDEGEDGLTSGEYLKPEDLKELGDDSLPTSHFLHDSSTYLGGSYSLARGLLRSFGSDKTFTPSRGSLLRDTVAFLVSFMVDARGGSMRGTRHPGLRILVPPQTCSEPTRVTCRLVRRQRLAIPPPMVDGEGLASRSIEVGPAGAQFLGKLHLPRTPPSLNEGESLVSRLLQLGPEGTNFLGPVLVEIPHFASLRGRERELVVLRSSDGTTWREHQQDCSEEELSEMLNGMEEELDSLEELERKRICRIFTRDFPQYFAVVSRVRQESSAIGPEGGLLSSSVVPQVCAVFPQGALTKRIKVGLQAHPIQEDMVRKLLGNKASFSPIVTVEPRRRKFHKPITMTIPTPKTITSAEKNALTTDKDQPPLCLLCSITGDWTCITMMKPETWHNDLFWLMESWQHADAVALGNQLYQEAISVPYLAKFMIFAKTLEPFEARLRCFCMTDDRVDKTLEQQEHFVEAARSRDVEVRNSIFVFFIFPSILTSPGIELELDHVRDATQEPCGRLSFMKEPKSTRGLPHNAVCNLNITLPPCKKETESDREDEEVNCCTVKEFPFRDALHVVIHALPFIML